MSLTNHSPSIITVINSFIPINTAVLGLVHLTPNVSINNYTTNDITLDFPLTCGGLAQVTIYFFATPTQSSMVINTINPIIINQKYTPVLTIKQELDDVFRFTKNALINVYNLKP